MTLRLISNPNPVMGKRLLRVMVDVAYLRRMTIPEIRGRYDELEAVRDAISQLLDKADGKQ
jgi:hypothetical protein